MLRFVVRLVLVLRFVKVEFHGFVVFVLRLAGLRLAVVRLLDEGLFHAVLREVGFFQFFFRFFAFLRVLDACLVGRDVR